MSLGMNTVIATVCRQQNANMQSHMRGYNLGEDFYDNESMPQQEEFRRLYKNFKRFIQAINRFLYRTDVVSYKYTDFSDWVNKHQFFDIGDVAKYLEMINDKILDDPKFSEVITGERDSYIRNLGSYYSVVNSNKGVLPRLMYGIRVYTSISYIPGVSNDDPNIIRIGVTEDYDNEFVNGNIDICSNGEIVIGDFDRIIYRIRLDPNPPYNRIVDKDGKTIYDREEREATIDDSVVVLESLNSIQEYIMNVFEMANLITHSKGVHR